MDSDRARILSMLKDGKISVAEAEELLDATKKPVAAESKESAQYSLPTAQRRKPKYLHVTVEPAAGAERRQERVNVRVPLQLLRAGIKLASVIPKDAKGKIDAAMKEKGLDLGFDGLTGDNLDDLVESLTELSIDVDSDDEKVKIFCE